MPAVMAQGRAGDRQLVEEVLPAVPARQWVLTVPHRLRYRLAFDHALCRVVLGVFVRAVLGDYRRRARRQGLRDGRGGAVTVIQRFGSGLQLSCVVVDGYGAYSALREAAVADSRPTFQLAHCWAHCRRKFVEAEPHFPQAAEILDQISRLYAIEARAAEADVADRGAHLAALRRAESVPVVASIQQWLLSQQVLPRSALGKAIRYTLGLWAGLVKFLDDAAIPLDTNLVERGLRALAIGRKNHYGSRSERGTKVAALFYSLIESAKLVGVEPAAYLAEATRRAIANPGTVTLPKDLAGT